MSLIRWLVDCLVTLFAAFKNALTDERVGPRAQSMEDMQERESQAALRDLGRLKNTPPEN